MRWYDGWIKRLADKYERPIHELEQMPIGAFYREIAILYADAIIREAGRMTTKTSDRKERTALDREWAKLKQSPDWFDRMVVERIHAHD